VRHFKIPPYLQTFRGEGKVSKTKFCTVAGPLLWRVEAHPFQSGVTWVYLEVPLLGKSDEPQLLHYTLPQGASPTVQMKRYIKHLQRDPVASCSDCVLGIF
jgi:hypothetical protein